MVLKAFQKFHPITPDIKNDLECAPLSGCGTQHPHRALGGTCVLLAAAPTTPPCFRRWRRSSSLHFAHHQRNNYLKFRNSGKSADFPELPFHGRGRNSQRHLQRRFLRKHGAAGERPRPLRQFASLTATSPKGRGLGMAVQFPAQTQSLRACSLPLGGAVAQRLRGYGWRSEKSVKAIAPTGAALAFLCFDFFFRIVKGE